MDPKAACESVLSKISLDDFAADMKESTGAAVVSMNAQVRQEGPGRFVVDMTVMYRPLRDSQWMGEFVEAKIMNTTLDLIRAEGGLKFRPSLLAKIDLMTADMASALSPVLALIAIDVARARLRVNCPELGDLPMNSTLNLMTGPGLR